jgi:DNA-directed RNA polymerase specialized sigma24 family protein
MLADGDPRFATTRWSLILAVRDPASPEAASALASLCEIYWCPVYAFIRRTGASSDAAGDLTQAFFTRVLEKGFFGDARQERGRFRAFLLAAVRHFLSNERDAARAKKRGGGRVLVPLEVDKEERRYLLEPVDEVTPEELYERRWAVTVLEAARLRAAERYTDPNRRRLFLALRPFLTSHDTATDTITAADLGMTDGAFRVAAHRLRKHFEQCLRDVIRETVARPEDVDAELRHVLTLSADVR